MKKECPYEALGKLSDDTRRMLYDAIKKRSEEIVKNAR